ncbi:hypothetical protein SAMN04488580_11858 [Mycobacterium sp. 283mftsu]|nr:hypothetical protein SAMN04488580_11858 [Mycobacterium sp. 283mftsu]
MDLPSAEYRGLAGLAMVLGRFRITRSTSGLSTDTSIPAFALWGLNSFSRLNFPSVTDTENESVCTAV